MSIRATSGTLLIVVVVALELVVSPGLTFAQAPPTADRQLDYYSEELALSSAQKEQIGKILSVDRQLADIDRNRYQNDPTAFQEATVTRVAETRKEIQTVLTPQQQQVFAQIKTQNRQERMDHAVADLTSRLKLDEQQSAQVEKIMAESRLGELRTKMQAAGSDHEQRRAIGSEIRDEMERVDKQIENILTDEQKKEYAKLKDERRESMEKERSQWHGGQGHGNHGGGWQ